MTRSMPVALLACSLLLPATALEADEASAHRETVEAWQARRLAALTRDDGWLTLTALHRLQEGTFTVGSDPEADLALPASAPALAGRLEVAGDAVTFHAEPAAGATVEGAEVSSVLLVADTDGEPTVVDLGSTSFFLISRGGVRLLRVRDSEHPALRDFPGLEYFPIDSAWHFQARFEPYDPVKRIPVANIIGIVEDSPSWGAVVFDHAGSTYRIDALAEPGDERLFLIFADATSGRETYGAGRYLYVDGPDAEGRIDLDFNQAYNPPCAFTAYATCPLPPRQNRLPLRIEAGEKNYELAH